MTAPHPGLALVADLERIAAAYVAAVEHLRAQPAPEVLLWTVKQTAVALGVSDAYVYQLAERREIPGVIKLGKTVRISRAAVERWIEEQAETQSIRLVRAG